MEPLQPMVRQGVAQLKDFITKLVDIQEKDGELFRAWPRPCPAHLSASRCSTHSLMLKFAPPRPRPPAFPPPRAHVLPSLSGPQSWTCSGP